MASAASTPPAIRRVVEVLRRAVGDAWQVDSQLPIALDDDSEPEPDVSVVARDRDSYRDAHPSRAVLIVEAAESSYRIDRHYKASLYARAGLPEHWIVDVMRNVLEVYRSPEMSARALYGRRYGVVASLRARAGVTPSFAPDVAIRVVQLLP